MITLSNKSWLLIAILIVLAILLVNLSPILSPFVIAAFFAYLLDPVADKLSHWRMSRTFAVSLIFVLMSLMFTLLFLLVVPMLFRQLVSFIHSIPAYLQLIQSYVLPHLQQLGIRVEAIPADDIKQLLGENWQKAGGIFTELVKSATASSMTIAHFFANLLLIPVVGFYLLRDWSHLLGFIDKSLPTLYKEKITFFAKQCDEVLSAFIRGQLMVMMSLGVIYSIGLSIVGLDLALFLGTIAGLASVVPYLGAIVGVTSSVLVAYMQFQDISHVLGVLVVFGVGQTLEGSLLTPILVGDKIGLHPVAVIFAIMAGGQLAGFIGILIALPVAAVLMVFVRYFHQQYITNQQYIKIDDEI